jgi:DHA2 family multidrug resistance protein
MTSSPPALGGEKNLTSKEWIGFIGLIFGMFMSVLDIQIVNSSLAQIQAGLSATSEEITWVQTAYLVAEVVMIPLSGWLARALSTRVLFFYSCLGFTIMSFGCALATSLPLMILARALQGFFGGGMIPTVFAVIFTLFPPKMQPKISVLVGLVVTIAPTIGPVLGGYLTDIFSWEALFLINIIPGIGVCLATWFFVDVDQPDHRLFKKIDFLGIIFITLFLGSVQFVLEEGNQKEWFDSSLILLFTFVAIISGICGAYRELTYEEPIVDLRAFKNKNFAVGCFFSFILGLGLYTSVYLLPAYLSSVKHLNSFQIGVYMMVTGAFQLLSAPLAGFCSQKMDLRFMFVIGFLTFGVGVWVMANLSYDAGYGDFFLPQALRGISLMFCFIPINQLSLGTLPKDQLKNASGLYNLMRNLGGAIGLAVVNTLMTWWSKSLYGNLRESVHGGSPQVEALLAQMGERLESLSTAFPHEGALKIITQLAQREALIITYNQLFILVSLFFFGGVFAIFLVKEIPRDKPIEGGH